MLRQLVILAILAIFTVDAFYNTEVTTDQEYLKKQKSIYQLLFHVNQPGITQELYKEGLSYNIKENIDAYTNKEAVDYFLHLYEHGFVPRNEVCSIYYRKHAEQTLALLRLFYYAKDFETFYKTALWARAHINPCIFSMAFYIAVIRRPDTMYLQLPFPYEMYPHLFFNSEVMEKADHPTHFAMIENKPGSKHPHYIISANYSGWYLTRDHDPEHKLNYFTEDIGMNTFYFYLKLDNPYFMSSKEFSMPEGYRGEEYLYSHKQILARYILERLSNDMDRTEDFDWHEPFHCGYYPTMTYHNGLPFPQRPHWSRFPYYTIKDIRDIQEYESRIAAAIDSGYAFCENGERLKLYEKENGASYLGNLIEGNMDSCNRPFYGYIDILSRRILGFNIDTHNSNQVFPSALQHWASSMRDPAFYRIVKRISDYYIKYTSRLKPYKREELIYPEYKIESVEVDKMQTFFDQYDASISNGLLVENFEEAESMIVKVRQWRLNHKPFNIFMNINAEKAGKACIRIFLGPKYDSHHKLLNFFDNYKYYYEIDNFMTTLNAGANKVERNSRDFFFLISDQDSAETYYNRIVKSLTTGQNFSYKQRLFGFPERLLLPRGKREGLPLQLFIYINPVEKETTYKSRVFGDYIFDNKNFGFPLDRTLNEAEFHGPNMIFKEVLIYHKDEHEINMTY